MGRFCINCGAGLESNAQFCVQCGAAVSIADEPAAAGSPPPKQAAQKHARAAEPGKAAAAPSPKPARKKARAVEPDAPAANRTFAVGQKAAVAVAQLAGLQSFAPARSGEFAFESALSALPKAASPFGVLFGGVARVFSELKALPRNRKAWVTAAVLAGIWLLVPLLSALGFNPPPVRFLSWLTFARGGLGGDALRVAGGVLGKGIFASLVGSVAFSGFKGMGGGARSMFSALRAKGPRESADLLFGAGAALAAYNFMAGHASLQMSMAAISAFLISLRALGGFSGFLGRMVDALTAKKTKEGRFANAPARSRMLAGLAGGFALAVPLSAVRWGYAPYAAAAAALVGAVVLMVLDKNKKEAAR